MTTRIYVPRDSSALALGARWFNILGQGSGAHPSSSFLWPHQPGGSVYGSRSVIAMRIPSLNSIHQI